MVTANNLSGMVKDVPPGTEEEAKLALNCEKLIPGMVILQVCT